MSKNKSQPMRMCIACRQMKLKKEMTRVVKTADGDIFADPTGQAAGRGAYVCDAEECRKKLNDKKLLHKAFAANVAPEVYAGVKGDALGEN